MAIAMWLTWSYLSTAGRPVHHRQDQGPAGHGHALGRVKEPVEPGRLFGGELREVDLFDDLAHPAQALAHVTDDVSSWCGHVLERAIRVCQWAEEASGAGSGSVSAGTAAGAGSGESSTAGEVAPDSSEPEPG